MRTGRKGREPGFPAWRAASCLALPALLVIPALPAAPAAGPASEVPAMQLDFSAVTSKAAARKLVLKGALVPIRLFPVELGGPDDPLNIGYVPPAAATALAAVTDALMQQAKRREIDRMEVVPDYKGESIVPSRIRFTAWHGKRSGRFETAVAIW